MRTDNFVLWATNLGDMYRRHLEIARMKCLGAQTWERHVRSVLLPAWRAEMDEPWDGMSRTQIAEVADALRDYYAAHLAEGADA